MLKKMLKATAKLEARAKVSGATGLANDSALSKKLRNAIVDLEARAKDHEDAAAQARKAAAGLRQLLRTEAPVAKVVTPAAAPTAKKPAPKVKRAPSRTVKKPTPAVAAVKKVAAAKKSPAAPKAKTKVPTKASAKTNNGPTLADAIQYVLKSRRDQNAGSAKASQLYAEVQQAGYRFGGNNVENRMNYLHKTLRKHAARFKRGADGTVSLA